jgi:RNA ligase (TIGR02306 family)
MPSSLIVRCVPIKNVRPHPNADNLIIIEIMGWQVCTHKDTNPEIDELRVFIPPDAVLTDELAEQLEVTKYLKKGNRVGQVRLRGEMSFGIAASNVWGFNIGDEVSEQLGITKYEPPPILGAGDQAPDHPLVPNYTRMENWRNYPALFVEGDPVYFIEKIHGTNSKVAILADDCPDECGDPHGHSFVIGSHNTNRKFSDDPKTRSIYQYPLKLVQPLLTNLIDFFKARVVVVYGEIFGKVQDLKYGRTNELAYRVIDIYVDGNFLDWSELETWCMEVDVEPAPVVYCGPYSEEGMKDCANQNTLLMPPHSAHMSEGIVIRPQVERRDPTLGRVILKYKSDAYEDRFARGKGTEFA